MVCTKNIHRPAQRHTEHQDATDIQKKTHILYFRLQGLQTVVSVFIRKKMIYCVSKWKKHFDYIKNKFNKWSTFINE